MERVWYVLHVKPRTEKQVDARLRGLGVFHYLPLYKKRVKVQRRKVVRYLPIFPGYVFTRLNADERREIVNTQYVVQTITVMQPRKMIHQLRQIVHAGRVVENMKPVKEFTVGERVRLTEGPLRGLEGYVTRLSNKMSIVLMVEMLGAGVEIVTNAIGIEPVENND